MDVTPQLLHDVEFREAKRGGYNTQDVDDFLERVAVGIERQEALLREARQRLEAAEARIAEAERRAHEAEQRASSTGEADETLKRTLVLAQRTADAAIREAEEEAARTLSSAQEQAARLLAEAQETSARARAEAEDEARRAHEGARAQVLAEMAELESMRDQLRHDAELLEQHVAHQRARLGRTAEEIIRLLEEPEALAEVPVPEVSDVTAPRPSAPAAQAPAPRPPLVAPPLEEVEPEPSAEVPPAAWAPDDEAWADDEPGPKPEPEADLEPDEGPATQPVDAVGEDDPDDDAYLRELRKAMTDDAPLGPRDDLSPHEGLFEQGSEAPRSRFGRRR
ncbi:MAG: DivIVA domain-containing protein [Acidimicrobiia bacterium]